MRGKKNGPGSFGFPARRALGALVSGLLFDLRLASGGELEVVGDVVFDRFPHPETVYVSRTPATVATSADDPSRRCRRRNIDQRKWQAVRSNERRNGFLDDLHISRSQLIHATNPSPGFEARVRSGQASLAREDFGSPPFFDAVE